MDHASPAGLAVHRNGPFHLVHQLLHDGHAQARAVIVRPRALVLLGKGLENVILEVLPNADSRIFNDEAAACRPLPEGSLLRPHKYGAVGPVIFEGVVNDAHQDLL